VQAETTHRHTNNQTNKQTHRHTEHYRKANKQHHLFRLLSLFLLLFEKLANGHKLFILILILHWTIQREWEKSNERIFRKVEVFRRLHCLYTETETHRAQRTETRDTETETWRQRHTETQRHRVEWQRHTETPSRLESSRCQKRLELPSTLKSNLFFFLLVISHIHLLHICQFLPANQQCCDHILRQPVRWSVTHKHFTTSHQSEIRLRTQHGEKESRKTHQIKQRTDITETESNRENRQRNRQNQTLIAFHLILIISFSSWNKTNPNQHARTWLRCEWPVDLRVCEPRCELPLQSRAWPPRWEEMRVDETEMTWHEITRGDDEMRWFGWDEMIRMRCYKMRRAETWRDESDKTKWDKWVEMTLDKMSWDGMRWRWGKWQETRWDEMRWVDMCWHVLNDLDRSWICCDDERSSTERIACIHIDAYWMG